MTATKLFQLLQTFSIYELNRFNKFLHSPYHNEDETLIQLYELLLPHFKAQTQHTITQNIIWKKLKGNTRFHAVKFARLFSDLLKKAEEFLVTDQLKHNESRKQINLVSLLNEKRLTKHYPEAAKLARKKLEQLPYRDGDYYLQLFHAEMEEHTFIELQNQRTAHKNLLQTNEALDIYYLINKLNYLAAILHYKNFLSLEGEVNMMQEVLAHLKKNSYENIPAISIYHCIVLSLTEFESEAHFTTLKTLLSKHYKLFNKTTAQNMYAFAVNYCIRKINFGKLDYIKTLLALYKQMLQANLMTDNNETLSQFDYKNIVTVGLRAGEVKWTLNFINNYKPLLPTHQQENAYSYNLAKVFFHQRKYDKVLPLLQHVEYTDIFYQLDSKATLMKVYFELGDYLPLMSLKESFRILLRRKKLINEQNRVNYMNFIRFTMKLFRADVKDQQKIKTLKKEISETKNIADKGWLLEKVEELE